MGDIISIEKVLNSRCSSSFDNCDKKNHWGTFTYKKPKKGIMRQILECLNIPQFSNGKLYHWFEEGYIYLGLEKLNEPNDDRFLNIESGMQQEAIYLACCALGVGVCIYNQGINGTSYREKITTGKFLIMEQVDPYYTGKYTTKDPGPNKPFKPGKNLNPPQRDGDIECLPQLKNLKLYNEQGSLTTINDISQLLWAAKGRTPHYILPHAWNNVWGLTIPTWGGGQNYTNVFLITDRKLFQYINWTKRFSRLSRLFLSCAKWTRGNPTHDIRFIRKINICTQFNEADTAIILCQNENTGRALWEVGYMIENMLLQASSLNICYELKIFKTEETSQLEKLKVKNVVAAILLKSVF
ncbi:MAG: hypothetical protein ACFFDN_06575 [Candidatus Hodarchaeota archaeon]